MTRWLIVGHGTVGSFLARRLVRHGDEVLVHDPAPRIAIEPRMAVDLADARPHVDVIASCVPGAVAGQIPALVAAVATGETLFLDWNTIAPAAKRAIAGELACETVDVALLDTVDGHDHRARLALSGGAADGAAELLVARGFDPAVAGAAVGDAAQLKYARSLLMKSLEALALEYFATTDGLDPDGIVARSVDGNLGDGFMAFLEHLVRTNRLHADRRAAELASAATLIEGATRAPSIAHAGAAVLARAAAAWHEPDAPSQDASLAQLVAHLSREPWTASR